MVYLLILQNSLIIDIVNIEKPTLYVNDGIQKNILETQINLYKQGGTATFQFKQKSTHRNRRLRPGNKRIYPTAKPRRQMATGCLPLQKVIARRTKL